MINAQEFFTYVLSIDDTVAYYLAYTIGKDGARLPNVFEYPCDEVLSDNPEKPYIVVQNTGTQAIALDKDMDSFDPGHDRTTIEVHIVANDVDMVKRIAKAARFVLRNAMDQLNDGITDFGFRLEDSDYSDRGIQFDPESMNYFATLTYQIETQNLQ